MTVHSPLCGQRGGNMSLRLDLKQCYMLQLCTSRNLFLRMTGPTTRPTVHAINPQRLAGYCTIAHDFAGDRPDWYFVLRMSVR